MTPRGTQEGEFTGIGPTSADFEVENSVFTRVEAGKTVERWVVPDVFGHLRQLGVDTVLWA